MTLAKRSLIALMAAFLGMALGLGLFVAQGDAYAATEKGDTLTAGQTTVTKKAKKTTTKGEKIAKKAASFSYSRAVYQGQGVGTEAYYKACLKLGGKGYYVKNKKQMQCNVPVAAAVRGSGVDKSFPKGNPEIYAYMKRSKNWKCLGHYKTEVTKLKPGDILIRIGGVTTYTGKDGAKHTASSNHACIYIGKDIATSIYKKKLKGTDADVGKPGSKRVFVSAHTSRQNASKRSASCLETAKEAYADCRMYVFRYKGK